MRILRPISRNRRRHQKGSSLLEGALALMAFLTMTMGLIEASMAIYAFNTVAYGAGAAARVAALHGGGQENQTNNTVWSDDDVATYVRTHSPGLISNRLRTRTQWGPDPPFPEDNSIGQPVKVRIEYDIIPLVHMVFGSTFTISSTATMTITK